MDMLSQRARGRGRGVQRKEKASSENQAGLGDKGAEGQEEPRRFVRLSRGTEGPESRPRATSSESWSRPLTEFREKNMTGSVGSPLVATGRIASSSC